ncbi:MAG: hypothetical protein IKJ99_09380 [Oscillospiraceae bacterium]|nr:hypothetical protein [Oscillospiraceae bacterium]
MKKTIAILMSLLLIMGTAAPVSAATPPMRIPAMPQISNIIIDISLDENVYENAVKKWLAEHPVRIILPTKSDKGN